MGYPLRGTRSGSANLTPLRRQIHVNSERVGVFIVAPGLLLVANQLPRGKNRTFLQAVAWGTLLVDAWLLLQWSGARKDI
jgi:hypothetical protein